MLYGMVKRQTCFDWLWPWRGKAWLAVVKLRVWETRTTAFYICTHVFPIKWRHRVSFLGGEGSTAPEQSETANYWKNTVPELQPLSLSLPASIITTPSLFRSPPFSLTSTTRRSSAALRVCRNSEPETEVNTKICRSGWVLYDNDRYRLVKQNKWTGKPHWRLEILISQVWPQRHNVFVHSDGNLYVCLGPAESSLLFLFRRWHR